MGDISKGVAKKHTKKKNRFRGIDIARLNRQSESISPCYIGWRNRFLGSLKVSKFGLCGRLEEGASGVAEYAVYFPTTPFYI
jgi:hypothetical protein